MVLSCYFLNVTHLEAMRVRPKMVALSMSVLFVSKVPCNKKLILFQHIRTDKKERKIS
jgi:hypothetical protein